MIETSILLPEFEQQLVETIATKGPIPLSEYIAMQNSHYYAQTAEIRTQENKESGDFSTMPEALSPEYGTSYCRLFLDLYESAIMSGGDITTIYSFGPGNATLDRDFLRELKTNYPEIYEKINYVVVERSPNFAEQAEALLSEQEGHGDKITVLNQDVFDFLEQTDVIENGFIFSNELWDVWGHDVATKTEAGWTATYIDYQDGHFIETQSSTLPLEVELTINDYESSGVEFETGDQISIVPAMYRYADLLQSKLGSSCVILNTDYGSYAGTPNGEIRVFKDGPRTDLRAIDTMGNCDVTGDVDIKLWENLTPDLQTHAVMVDTIMLSYWIPDEQKAVKMRSISNMRMIFHQGGMLSCVQSTPDVELSPGLRAKFDDIVRDRIRAGDWYYHLGELPIPATISSTELEFILQDFLSTPDSDQPTKGVKTIPETDTTTVSTVLKNSEKTISAMLASSYEQDTDGNVSWITHAAKPVNANHECSGAKPHGNPQASEAGDIYTCSGCGMYIILPE